LAVPAALRLARTADVLHTTTYTAALPAWLASRALGKPAVITVHEVFGPQWHALEGLSPLARSAFPLSHQAVLSLPFDPFLCDSSFTRERLRKLLRVPLERSSVVYPPLDYAFWTPQRHPKLDLRGQLGLDPGSFVMLYFGRPGVSKGIEYL